MQINDQTKIIYLFLLTFFSVTVIDNEVKISNRKGHVDHFNPTSNNKNNIISISNKSNNSRRNRPEKTSTDPTMFRVMHSNAVSPFFFPLVTLPRFSHEPFTFLLFFRFCRNACTRVHAAIQLNILVGSPCT